MIQRPLLVRDEKSKIASTRNKCKGLWYMDGCTDYMYNNSYQINNIYFCSVCLNFEMIHLNLV